MLSKIIHILFLVRRQLPTIKYGTQNYNIWPKEMASHQLINYCYIIFPSYFLMPQFNFKDI